MRYQLRLRRQQCTLHYTSPLMKNLTAPGGDALQNRSKHKKNCTLKVLFAPRSLLYYRPTLVSCSLVRGLSIAMTLNYLVTEIDPHCASVPCMGWISNGSKQV
jgi:hypothetical protein